MKRKRYKKIFLIYFALFVVSVLLSGCELYPSETVAVNTTIPRVDPLSGNDITLQHNIEGIQLTTNYKVGNNYTFDQWRITDSKSIQLSVNCSSLPDGTEIMLEHMHADVSLKSTSAQLDGLTQDSMDDSFHGYSQDGFVISPKYQYETIFAIEGFSKDIIDGWNFYCGSYGSGEITSQRLSEQNLTKHGTYANKLTVVYDVLIKNKGEKYYHVKSFSDEILIPIKVQITSGENGVFKQKIF